MKANYRRYEDRETLERIKRWPQLIGRFPRVRIYSAEHDAYWRRYGQGYTVEKGESAVWDCMDAFRKTMHCDPIKGIQFVDATSPSNSTIGKAAP